MELVRPIGRRIWLVVLLTALGLLRAERGVAELQDRAVEPSRMFRLVLDADSDTWSMALLGWQGSASASQPLYHRVGPLLTRDDLRYQWQRIKQALP